MNTALVPGRAHAAEARLAGVRARIAAEGWAGVLVLDVVDIAWLTGLETTNAALIVTPRTAVLVTDFRYIDKARNLGLEVRRVDQALFHNLGEVVGEAVGSGAVAYSPSSLSHRAFLNLTEALPEQITLRATEGVVADLRAVKDSAEIDAVRRAAALLEAAYQDVVIGEGLAGRRERDVVWAIERFLREHGADGMSFDGIVAGGANGALPHHSSGTDVIPQDTLVTVDIGCVVDGYCSDCTRTFAVGDPAAELRRIYEVCLEAQEAALAAVRPGAVGREVDAVARDIIEAAGFGERFGHGLGHGVGREIHEGPRLTCTSEDVLVPGHVVTIEPGIYLPGVGGVRIEDLVVVTDDGCQVLTGFTKELVTTATTV